MQITHLGHAAILIEVAGRRIVLDPGNFSDAWHGLTGLDAVLVTHQHPDHVDPEHIGALLAANPQAAVYAEPGVLTAVDLHGDQSAGAAGGGQSAAASGGGQPLTPDTSLDLGGVRVAAVGDCTRSSTETSRGSATSASSSPPRGSRRSSTLATRWTPSPAGWMCSLCPRTGRGRR